MIVRKNKKIYFDQKDIMELTQKLSTPFFLFSERSLTSSYLEFKQNFSSHYKNIRIDYSVKTNCELGILRILNHLGSHLEIASGQELYLAQKAGFPAKKVVFDGPCKTHRDIAYAIEQGIHAFYVDSWVDLQTISHIAKKRNRKFNYVVRVSLDTKGILSGVADKAIKKFGVPVEDVFQLVVHARDLEKASYLGLSAHIGSQNLTPDPYLKLINELSTLALNLERQGFTTQEINLGGGYPSQTLNKTTVPSLLLLPLGIRIKQKPLPLKEFGLRISRHFSHAISRLNHHPVMALQPGRSITSEMGIAVSKVKVVKKNWVFLDVSTSSLPESVFFAQREIILASEDPQNRKFKKYSIAGSGLNTADNFILNRKMPELKVGDTVIILDAGAYSISRANRFTILNPPVYLILKNGTLLKIRRQENYEDILEPMKV